MGFRLFLLLGNVQASCLRSRRVFDSLESTNEACCLFPRRTIMLALSAAQPCPCHPAVRPDPTRPWFVRVLDSTGFELSLALFAWWSRSADVLKNLLSPKTGHTTGVSLQGAQLRAGEGSGRTDGQQNCSPRGQSFFVPSKAWKTRRLKIFQDKTNKRNPMQTDGRTKLP